MSLKTVYYIKKYNDAKLWSKQALNYRPIDKGGRDKNRSPNT